MVKLINAFKGTDPTANVLAEMGKRMFGDQLTPAIKREQFRKLDRENTELELLGGEYQDYGTPQYDPRRVAARATLSGDTDYANRERFLAANTGQDMDVVSRAFSGAGGAWSGTPIAHAQELAEKGRQADAGYAEQRRNNDIQSSDRRYDTIVGSADNRYGVDQRVGEDARQFGVSSAETFRNNNLTSVDRRYGVDQGVGQQRYEFNFEPKPVLGADGAPTFVAQGQMVGSGVQPILSNTERQGTLAGQNFGQMGALPIQEQTYLDADPTAARAGAVKMYRTSQGQVGRTSDGILDLVTGALIPADAVVGSINDTAGGFQGGELSKARQDIATRRYGVASMIERCVS